MNYVLSVLLSLFAFNVLFAQDLMSISPFMGEMGTNKKLFGTYPRGQIKDSSAPMFRIVGLIEMEDGICTGTLIGPRHILTAAHCVYDHESGAWTKSAVFTPGRLGEAVMPFGSFNVVRSYVNDKYIHSLDYALYDYAVMELDTDIGNKLGWAGLTVTSSIMTNLTIDITGYPGDKEIGTLWNVQCPAQIAEGTQLLYRCDTFGGMSGSALKNKNVPNAIIGLHTYGNSETNGGLLLTPERLGLIQSWIKNTALNGTVTYELQIGAQSSEEN